MKLRIQWVVLAACAVVGVACGNESTNTGSNPPADTAVTGDSAAGTDASAADTAKADAKADTGKADTGTSSWKPASACWAEKCGDEVAACAEDQACVDFADCVSLGQANDPACTDGIDDLSKQLYQEVEVCGYSSCADPNGASCKGQCGNFSNDAPCNCDDACSDYGDCCSDYEQECKTAAVTSCKDRCDAAPSQDSCNCDADCEQYEDCCEDYAQLCKAPPADTTGGDTSGDDATIGQDTTASEDVSTPADTTATGG